MMRALNLLVTGSVAFILLYISRFWPFQLWDRPGLFGLRELPPQGGLLQRWLRGTELAPYELLIWFMLGFIVLSGLEKLSTTLKRHGDES